MESGPLPVEVVRKDGATYRIRRLTEVSQILPRLEKDRVFCAYAICHLEPERFQHTRWYVAEGDTGEALVMHGTGSLNGGLYGYGADLFCMGESAALDAILSLHHGPRYVSRLWAQVEHGLVLKRHLLLWRDSPFLLYGRHGGRDPNLGPDDNPARRLTSADIGEINRLRRAAGSFGVLRGKLIDQGDSWGIYEDGHLVALNYGEIRSPIYGVMVGGRLDVHPAYRGRRYADLLLYAWLRDPSNKNAKTLIVNTVDPMNPAAVQLRQRRIKDGVITRESEKEVLATSAFRRDPVGLASLVRRVMARRRAKRGA